MYCLNMLQDLTIYNNQFVFGKFSHKPLSCFELVGDILKETSEFNLILLEHCSTETGQTCMLHILDTILVHCILHILGTILVHCLI